VVRSIVRAHGGDIAVKSRVGSGTTVSVTLPALTLSSDGDV
jgi:signal transduction histidine kinase